MNEVKSNVQKSAQGNSDSKVSSAAAGHASAYAISSQPLGPASDFPARKADELPVTVTVAL